MKLLFAFAIVVLALPAAAQTPDVQVPAPGMEVTPTPASKFDWKLRLYKGQTWMQRASVKTTTTTSSSNRRTVTVETQNFNFKQEVLEAWPTFYKIRATFTRFQAGGSFTVDGQTHPVVVPAQVLKALAGITFTMKQRLDGEITEVTGLEAFVEQMKKALRASAKSSAERATLERAVPSVASFRQLILKSNNNFQPQTPLAIGESYSYSFPTSLGAMYPDPMTTKVTRTLGSFDSQKARFENSGNVVLSATRPVVMEGAKVYVALTGTLSGPLVVQPASGIVSRADITTKLSGKTTVVATNGQKETTLMTSNSQFFVETIF